MNNLYSSSSDSRFSNAFMGSYAAASANTNNNMTRRAISDSSVVRSSHLPMIRASRYDNRNTTFMMINRSGGSTVKKIIPRIIECCDQTHLLHQEQQQLLQQQVPEEECYILAQWAVDSYYKVVIAGNGGIPALIRAMQSFPQAVGLQESCCLALGNLCNGSEANQDIVNRCEGIRQIVVAMKDHPKSVVVQSAACDALRNMRIQYNNDNSSSSNGDDDDQHVVLVQELVLALQHAKQMYLHPRSVRNAEQLLGMLVTANTASASA